MSTCNRKTRKIIPTVKQEQAFNRYVENHGNVSKSMLEVNYTPATARNPSNLTQSKGWQIISSNYLQKLVLERNRVIEAMTGKNLSREKYSTLSDSVDKMTRSINLLNGGDTDKINVKLSWE